MLLGKRPAMQVIHQFSNNSERTILIMGEIGVGKDLVAQAIHFGEARASKPFVPVNCSPTPATLWESTFFGHAHGAFTGATENHKMDRWE